MPFKTEEVKKIPILTSISPGFKVAYLFLFLFIGLFIASVFARLILMIPGIDSESELTIVYAGLISQSVFAIAIPAYLIVAWTNPKPASYFKLKHDNNLPVKMFFALLVFLVSYMFTSLLGQWNKGFALPESLKNIEEFLRSAEDAALETTNLLLSVDSIALLLLNIVVIAGFAAVSEEMFFRGALQQFISEKFKNKHVTVWIAALIFSLVHFQFYGFLPRLFLGALLGYLYVYTRNLWVPIFFHFINNASVIVVHFYWRDTEFYKSIDEATINSSTIIMGLVSLILTVLLFIRYKRRNLMTMRD